jgi:hypothetical protein
MPKKYAGDLLKRTRMAPCKRANTPLDIGEKLRAHLGTMLGLEMQQSIEVLWVHSNILLSQDQI